MALKVNEIFSYDVLPPIVYKRLWSSFAMKYSSYLFRFVNSNSRTKHTLYVSLLNHLRPKNRFLTISLLILTCQNVFNQKLHSFRIDWFSNSSLLWLINPFYCILIRSHSIPIKLPWIFTGYPLKMDVAPGNIQGMHSIINWYAMLTIV